MIVLAAQVSWANPKGMSEKDRRFWNRKPFKTLGQIAREKRQRQDAGYRAFSSAFESNRRKH